MADRSSVILPALLLVTAFFVAGPKNSPLKTNDFRDAPNSSALDALGYGFGGAPQAGAPAVPAPSAAGTVPGTAMVYPAMPQKEWTILVFLNAKNDLESFGMGDMNEMERIGSGKKFNVVVQLGRTPGEDASDGDWSGVRRYYMLQDKDQKKINSPMLENLGMADMGDYRELVKFVNWGKQKYPAEKYLLIVWNHGAGWPGISFDGDTGNYITTPQLAGALAATGGVDVMATDACLMQMAEVAYELKDFAKYIVGSEETIPGKGYGYHKILRRLKFNSGRDAESMGSMITRTYGQYMIGDKGATLSSLDASQLPRLAQLMDGFARAAMASGPEGKKALKTARDEAYKYAEPNYKDLSRFVMAAAKHLPDGELKTLAKQLSRHIKRDLVDTRRRNLFSIDTEEVTDSETGEVSEKKSLQLLKNKSKGLSAYLPEKAFSWKYSQLKLARDTQWDEFVQWLQQP
ncbi:MAG TPA: clostripain-related cysteine peptidase [Elusimicrobiales bacterium]|nr:clostripain-related cysteine peptidase [Elusimicrobiales bacterium]